MNPLSTIGDIFNLVFFGPIVNLVVFIIRILDAAHIPGSLGLSIIILTVGIRLLIWPFMASQLRSAKKMSDLKPHLDELKKKHAQDKQALAQAQMELYKQHGVNPAGGCLPTLIQIPVILALYQTILAFFGGSDGLGRINHALYFPSWQLQHAPDPHFLGASLADKPADFAKVGVLILLVPIITALLQFIQSKMMTPQPVKKYPSDSPKEKHEKVETQEAMSAVQGQMSYLMPIMIGYFAFTFPIGIAIYWNTFTLLGIWQQYQIAGWGGLANLISRIRS